MICENCGAEIRKNVRYCPDCGMDIPEYKPLQIKYLHGEYQEDEEEFSDDNEEYNHSDESHYKKYSNGEEEYQNEEYEAYEVSENQRSGWSSIILLLIVALLIGLIMGFIFFSGKLMNIPSVP
ncbi:MAG: zinc ribbon domain-containing protein [Methanobacteriaceae archaeon]